MFAGLVWRITVVIDEIAAHPPDFTELFSFRAVESLKLTLIRVDKRVVVVIHVVFVGGVGVQRCAQRKSLKDGLY